MLGGSHDNRIGAYAVATYPFAVLGFYMWHRLKRIAREPFPETSTEISPQMVDGLQITSCGVYQIWFPLLMEPVSARAHACRSGKQQESLTRELTS
jgi:hypothetical protein